MIFNYNNPRSVMKVNYNNPRSDKQIQISVTVKA